MNNKCKLIFSIFIGGTPYSETGKKLICWTNLFQCRSHCRHSARLEIFQFIHEGLKVLFPSGFDVLWILLKG